MKHLARPDLRAAALGALPAWVASRFAVALLGLGATWMFGRGQAAELPRFTQTWDRWDVGLFTKVARYGYFAPEYAPEHTEPFFPGMPIATRMAHAVVPDWIAAGLLVSLLAGAVACVALWQLAADERGPEAGGRAVLYLVVFPYAVFLFAGYSEALFLAFATTSWLAARRGRWWLAGLLAAGAAGTRLTGLCLAAALAVEYLVSRRRAGKPVLGWDVFALAVPAVPVVAYFGYLRSRTGHWDAYSRAQEAGWGRRTVSPFEAFENTWRLAENAGQHAPFLWSFRAEILAVLLGVALTAALLAARRFGEAAYVGTNTAILSVSSFYASGVRAALVWFPLYLLLSRVTVDREWLHAALLWVSAPLMALLAVAFSQGVWIG